MQSLLKFITCGSVDDGKSTLIGHILYDSKLLYADQEKALELDSKVGSREGGIDYSLLLDGLMAEREQGITIDVAYRYFTTEHRSFIVADTPGHEEYTRNMAVGASFADLAVILIDATQGVQVQTRRHARICSLMGIEHFVFAVNKMDLVSYEEKQFREIEQQIAELVKELSISHAVTIPVSATVGDNVMVRSRHMEWFTGPVLVPYLERVDVTNAGQEEGFYMPVQRVCRPNHEFRGFQGQIENGTIATGQEVMVLPSGEKARVKSIYVGDRQEEKAVSGQPVTIQLDKEIDVSRGCVLSIDSGAAVTTALEMTLLWMDDVPLTPGKNFYVKIGTRQLPGTVTEILYAIDVNTGQQKATDLLEKNALAVCRVALADEIVADTFAHHKTLGESILIDRVSNMTAACGVVRALLEKTQEGSFGAIDREIRSGWKNQRAITIEVQRDNLKEAEALARELERKLSLAGRHTYVYRDKTGEPAEQIMHHLKEAGIVVLYATTQKEACPAFAEDRTYYSNWETPDMTLADMTEKLLQLSSVQAGSSEHGAYI